MNRPYHPLNGICTLPHLGIIRVQGDDAQSFLQGQLTQDFALLKPEEARLAAFCSAKGRMQASFVGWLRAPGEVLLVCSADLLAPTLKRLAMFVMRAKARLSDATADFALYGMAGDALAAATVNIATDARGAWTRHLFGLNDLVFLPPADGQARALWLQALDAPPPAGNTLHADIWHWGEVKSGVATITAPIVDAFVPQMLNYESVGGVNFKKGCYPGQEVVARSQFRGTLKRRAFMAQCDVAINVGDEVFHTSDPDQTCDPDQPCGLVAQVAPQPGGAGTLAIVSMQVSAATGGTLTAQSAQGPALTLQALPYLLLADV